MTIQNFNRKEKYDINYEVYWSWKSSVFWDQHSHFQVSSSYLWHDMIWYIYVYILYVIICYCPMVSPPSHFSTFHFLKSKHNTAPHHWVCFSVYLYSEIEKQTSDKKNKVSTVQKSWSKDSVDFFILLFKCKYCILLKHSLYISDAITDCAQLCSTQLSILSYFNHRRIIF